jgi:hypothetical protein
VSHFNIRALDCFGSQCNLQVLLDIVLIVLIVLEVCCNIRSNIVTHLSFSRVHDHLKEFIDQFMNILSWLLRLIDQFARTGTLSQSSTKISKPSKVTWPALMLLEPGRSSMLSPMTLRLLLFAGRGGMAAPGYFHS